MPIKPEVDSIVNGLAKLVLPIYEDFAQPATREIGIALQTVAKTVHIALAPVSALVWGYDQIKDFINEKIPQRLKNVPSEEIVTPALNVAGPLFEALRYTGCEPELSELYANLLAASMDKSMRNGTHPAFVEIIKQLTPDEAKLIQLFANQNLVFPLLTVRLEYKNPNTEINGGYDQLSNFSIFADKIGLKYKDQMPLYIGNLCRLQLIEIPEFFEFTAPGIYQNLETAHQIIELKKEIENNPDLKCILIRKGIKITNLGKKFIEVCVKNRS